MTRNLTGIIEDAERSPLPWGYVAATFLAMVLARNLLEGALGPNGAIGFVYFTSPSSLMVLDHFALFYTSLFLSFALILSALTRERVGAVIRVMTPAWALLLLPPVLDYMLTSGEGMKITYVLDLRPVVLRFFDPRASFESISPGQRVEILGACLLAAAYVRLKTRSWAKATVGFLAIYVALALHGVLPSLFARGSLAFARAAASAEFAYFSAFKAGGIVADESRKLALLFLLTSSVLGWFAYRRHAPEKSVALWRSIRPLRALHYLGLVSFGIAFGWTLFSRYGVEFAGAGDMLGMLAACLATFCAFQASVAVNDLFDEEGDRVAGERRPLVEGTLTRRDLTGQALVFSAAALLYALNVKYSTFLFMALALIVSFVYSAPPLRLKRFPLVSSLALGLVSLTACLVGFSVYAEERALALFPSPLAWVIVLSFGLGFAAKDLKDVDGDEATGVWTLPVLLGPAAGRVGVAVLVFLGYLSVAVLMPYRVLTVPSILLGLASAAMVFVWRRPRLAELLLALCLIFTAAVAFVALSNIEPLLERTTSSGSALEARASEFRASTAEAWGDWASASVGFTEAARVFEDDPDVQLRAGATLFEQGRYREALPYLAHAADLDRSSPIALEYLTRAESRAGRVDSAEWLMREAVREGVRSGVFHSVLGEHYLDKGDPQSAARAFESALMLGRPDVPVRLRLGDALMAAGRTPEARAHYETAVMRRPSSAEARDALGRFHAAVREADPAVRQLEEAVRLDPESAVYWNNLGAALRLAGRHRESLDAIDEALRQNPRAPEPHYNRGLTLDALGRTNEARRQYLLALEIDPGHSPARAALDRGAP
ncbi:MAG: tetratricopeptide repeat protein [Candidatus Eisenbacteria bacterium]